MCDNCPRKIPTEKKKPSLDEMLAAGGYSKGSDDYSYIMSLVIPQERVESAIAGALAWIPESERGNFEQAFALADEIRAALGIKVKP